MIVFREIVARLSGVEPAAVGLKALARTVRKRLDDGFRSSGFVLQEAGGRAGVASAFSPCGALTYLEQARALAYLEQA